MKSGEKMSQKHIKRSLPVFPIGTVMMLTDLSARQIRYYEEQGVVIPKRSQTNRRLYSLNDIDTLLDIKDYLNEGLTLFAIRKLLSGKLKIQQSILTDDDVRNILHQELQSQHDWRHHM